MKYKELIKEIEEMGKEREEEEMEIELWDVFGMYELVEGLVGWGYGSGEEMFEWMVSYGLSSKESNMVIDLLNKVLDNVDKEIKIKGIKY